LSDSTGAITDTYDYSAYGAEIDSTGITENSYRYTGEQFDAESGNYYLRARYYDPSNGRFTQQDTFLGWENGPGSKGHGNALWSWGLGWREDFPMVIKRPLVYWCRYRLDALPAPPEDRADGETAFSR